MQASTSEISEGAKSFINTFWQEQFVRSWPMELSATLKALQNVAENEQVDFKRPSIPLARIKKIMKTSDPDVKMIAAEVPIVFSKACEAFIAELTLRAWQEAEKDKRKTITRADLHRAARKDPMYDFLVDFLPREPDKPASKSRPKAIENQLMTS